MSEIKFLKKVEGANPEHDLHFSFASYNKAYITVKETATYEIVGYIHFRGTTILGTPANIKVIANVDVPSNPGNIKIYDSTNANTIAEKTGITNTTPTLVDLGALSNLPSGEAIFEIQGKSDAIVKGEDLYIQTLNVHF